MIANYILKLLFLGPIFTEPFVLKQYITSDILDIKNKLLE